MHAPYSLQMLPPGHNLNVRDGGIVNGLTWIRCTKPDEMLEAFTRARANVVYAETKMNKASSRSHAIFQLRISKRERVFEAAKTGQKVECTIARLNVVDLAGSERVKKSGSEGMRFQEATNINRSLLAFGTRPLRAAKCQSIKKLAMPGNVVSALAARKSHIPLRDSKLTRTWSVIEAKPRSLEASRLWITCGYRLYRVAAEAEPLSLVTCDLLASSPAWTGAWRAAAEQLNWRIAVQILDGSIGGNCRTALLVCVNPAFEHAGETQNTLEFASRAMRVEVDAKVNTALVEVSAKTLLADLNPEAHEFGKKVQADKKEIEALRKQTADAAEQAKREAEKREKAVQEAESNVKKLQQAQSSSAQRHSLLSCLYVKELLAQLAFAMAVVVVSAPPRPLVCAPGATVEVSWALHATEALAPGASLCVRATEAAVVTVPDTVPAGCTVELALEVPAPKVTGAVVYDFVFRSSDGQLINDNLSLVLDIRDEPEERRALAHPNLGIFPGAHTRKIYFGAAPALTSTEPAAVEPPKVSLERTEETEWALLSRTRLDALPDRIFDVANLDYLAKRFGRPGEATVRFWVNGEEQVINSGQFPLSMNLAEYMRYHAGPLFSRQGLPGTKIGCGEGGCGACTVLLRRGDLLSLKAAPVLCNACLRPLHSNLGSKVTTVEEVGTPEKPHAIQSAIAKHSASQCGMCTPGMVMALYGHLAKGGSREPQDRAESSFVQVSNCQAIEGCIQGNLCRCTGYRPIHDAMKDAASRPDCTANVGEIKDLADSSKKRWRSGTLRSPPRTYAAALPHRLVVGNTSTGVIKYYPPHPNDHPTVFINVQTLALWRRNVGEMKAIEHSATSLTLGAACTLSTMIEDWKEIDKATAAAPQLAAIVRHLKLVAHPQVRDVGSWAGNVMIAKTHPDFPSDVCLLLTTLGAELKLMDEDRKIQSVDIVTFLSDAALPRGGAKPQIIHSVTIPFPGANTYLDTFKIMRRHMNTHAELNAGFLFQFAADGGVGVSDVRMVFGNALRGQPLTSATIQSIGKVLRAEIEAHIQGPSVPEPPFLVVDKEYRVNLACNLFAKAALRGRQARGAVLTPEELSAATTPERMESTGDQKFTVDPATAPIGQPLEKFQALDQACGTAQYVADEPIRPRTLFGVPVLAEKVAVVKCIDVVECMEVAGVTNFISAADVKELGRARVLHNRVSRVRAENDLKPTCPTKIFADTTEPTKHVAQFVGMVLADTLEAARCGARLVHVEYVEDTEQAEPVVKERHGALSVGKAPGAADLATVEGKLSSAGQKHFYLETQTTYAYPDGMGGLVVNSSCQTLDWAQTMLCKVFHLPKSKVTVQNQRIGGAYGGKAMLFAPVCAATAVAAMRTKRPVMVQLDRTPDFRSLGARAPFEASWSCSYDVSSGKIGSLKQDILQNVGFDMLGFSQASSVNCYDIPHAQLHCKGAVTDLPCNTWMRAPGDFEGAIIMEAIMEQVARAAQKELPPEAVFLRNVAICAAASPRSRGASPSTHYEVKSTN
eukprot:s102_g3.t1